MSDLFVTTSWERKEGDLISKEVGIIEVAEDIGYVKNLG